MRALLAIFLAFVLTAGCSSDDPLGSAGDSCHDNSDCIAPLTCQEFSGIRRCGS